MAYSKSSRSGWRPSEIVTANARKNRKALTPAERMLWARIRNHQLGLHIRRQHVVGPYIADFCYVPTRVVFEIDGAIHNQQAEQDAARTEWLEANGHRVIRFANAEVTQDIERVLEKIRAACRRAG